MIVFMLEMKMLLMSLVTMTMKMMVTKVAGSGRCFGLRDLRCKPRFPKSNKFSESRACCMGTSMACHTKWQTARIIGTPI